MVASLTLVIRMSSEVCQLCLEALTPLAEQCAKAREADSPLLLATRHFLKVGGHVRLPRMRRSPSFRRGERLVSAMPSGATSGQLSASISCS